MNKKKKGSVIARAFGIAAQGKGLLVASCLSSMVGMLARVIPYLSVYFIARQLLMPPAGSDTRSVLLFWILIAGVSILMNLVFSFLGSYGCHRVAFRLLYNFRVRVMEHIGRLPSGFFANHTTGSLQKTMDENIEKIEGFVAHMLPDIIGSAAVLVTLFTSLILLNGWLALAVVATIIAAVVVQMTVFGGKKSKQLWVDLAEANANMTGAFSEYVKGMAEVKLFGLTAR
ncbi:MAG: ABC transporter transmembrane domain-containing protein [Suipraeoptans sp.]